MSKYLEEWDKSYSNGDNHAFYSDYHLLVFLSRYIKKKTGVKTFETKRNYKNVLEVGCGIGSNTFLLDDFGFDVTSVDLSNKAISVAKQRAIEEGREHLVECFQQADASNLPFDNNNFDFVTSISVLDSMPLEVAKKAFDEIYRVLKPGGLFHLNLVCADGYKVPLEFYGAVVVEDELEKGTIQLYYNWELIKEITKDKFDILDAELVERSRILATGKDKRYYLTLCKK